MKLRYFFRWILSTPFSYFAIAALLFPVSLGEKLQISKEFNFFGSLSHSLLQSFYFVIGNHIFDILHTQLFTSFYHYLHSRCPFFSRLLWCLLFICLLSAAPPGTVSFRTEMKAFCALYSCIGSIIITVIDTKFLSSRIEKLNHKLILIESIVRAVPIVSVLLLFLLRYFIFFLFYFFVQSDIQTLCPYKGKNESGRGKIDFSESFNLLKSFSMRALIIVEKKSSVATRPQLVWRSFYVYYEQIHHGVSFFVAVLFARSHSLIDSLS